MNKIISLIKVSLNHDMNLFKINSKKQNQVSKIVIPLILTLYLMFVLGFYASGMMKLLKPIHMEFVVITFFSLAVSFMTLIEGIYKSSSLLFNCKDDNLMFSLPIKRSTVLFIRIFKFYAFEFLYNSLFLIPAIVVYAANISVSWTYYLASFFALLLLPAVPVALSCFIGFIITSFSSKTKGKNIAQTVLTMLVLLAVFYISYNTDSLVKDLAKNASSLNDMITKLYYPVGAYVSLVNDFNIKTFIFFIINHVALLFVTVLLLGKVYFRVNTNFKKVLGSSKNKKYIIKKRSKVNSFVRKELARFVNTPVFITNAGFGLVLFIIMCVFASIKYDTVISTITKTIPDLNSSLITSYLPVVMFGVIAFASFMTSITSSMISLEGKSFSILKSLPVQPFKIVFYKIVAALVIMIPCILIGDVIVFIRFKFDFLSIILLLIASLLLPFLSELIGILANLKYPKMDATNDTEVVKQSMSSMISVFIGLGVVGLTIFFLFKLIEFNLEKHLILLLFLGVFGIICLGLWILLVKKGKEYFNNISD